MQDKIQEIMGLVVQYGLECKKRMAHGVSGESEALAAISYKLRDLVREPLSVEAAQKLWAETTNIDCQSGGVALVRKVERAHNITNTSN